MFPRSQRLQQRQAFDPLYRRGRIARGTMLTIRCIAYDKAGLTLSSFRPAGDTNVSSRIAVIVSKKVSRKAVERNRIKRRVRHQLREFSNVLVANYCIAVSANRPRNRDSDRNARPRLLICSVSDIHRELRSLLERVHLIEDPADL
ncbi:MAG: ribonuclease P protein component [Synechococcus sp.]